MKSTLFFLLFIVVVVGCNSNDQKTYIDGQHSVYDTMDSILTAHQRNMEFIKKDLDISKGEYNLLVNSLEKDSLKAKVDQLELLYLSSLEALSIEASMHETIKKLSIKRR